MSHQIVYILINVMSLPLIVTTGGGTYSEDRNVQQFVSLLREALQDVTRSQLGIKVPLLVKVAIGENWGGMTPYCDWRAGSPPPAPSPGGRSAAFPTTCSSSSSHSTGWAAGGSSSYARSTSAHPPRPAPVEDIQPAATDGVSPECDKKAENEVEGCILVGSCRRSID